MNNLSQIRVGMSPRKLPNENTFRYKEITFKNLDSRGVFDNSETVIKTKNTDI
jgi:hypothetical protein